MDTIHREHLSNVQLLVSKHFRPTNLHVACIRPTHLVGKLLTQTSLASRLPWLPSCSKPRLTNCRSSQTLRPCSSTQSLLLLLSQTHNLLLLLLRALMLLRSSRVCRDWLLLSTRPTTIR